MLRRRRKTNRRAHVLRALAGSSPTRRGTILVVILGALALLSVITVAYVSVGKGDRRTAAVVRRDSDVNDAIQRHIDHIVIDVIGADVLGVYKPAPGTVNAGFAREGWDYPYTGWNASSDDVDFGDQPLYRFSPAGSFPVDYDPGFDNDINNHPAFPGSDPWLADLLPTRLNYEIDPPAAPRYTYVKDWGHISNIAPDGRFINLFNLRGNFDAEAGGGLDVDGFPRLSQGLTLFRDNGQPYNVNMNSYPASNSTLDFANETAQLDMPAHWDSRQRHMFRPAHDAVNGADSPLHLNYQYADADGDGFYDSRWQILVDASDPNKNVSIIPQNGQYRWVIATRIVDLSSMLNVNTATSITRGSSRPDEDYPIGASPADVDLLRMLASLDQYDEYGDVFMDGYVPPQKFELSFTLNEYLSKVNRSFSSSAARRVFSAIYRTITDNRVADQTVANVDLTPKQRLEHYRARAGYFDDVGLSEQPIFGTEAIGVGGIFSVDDQIELLTFHGVNDDTQVSRLERAVGGMVNGEEWYSPLRDNWPTLLERGFNDVFGAGGNNNRDGFTDPDAEIRLGWDSRRLLTTVSGARSLQSNIIRTVPGSPYEINVKASMIRLDLGVLDTPLDAYSALLLASGDNGAQPEPFALFDAYVSSLMPHIDEIAVNDNFDAWENPGMSPYATTTYGDNPLFAYLTAAHMAANAVDQFDEDRQGQHSSTRGPSAFTVVFSNDFGNGGDFLIGSLWEQMTVAPEFLPSKNNLPVFNTNGAVNIYGVEAQPFISEVSSVLVFADQHVGNGGDGEYIPPPNNLPGFEIDPAQITINGHIDNANGDFVVQLLAFQLTNPFDEEVHLTSMDVGDGESVGANEFLYYIEYAGETYKLAEVMPTLGAVPPGDGGNQSGLMAVTLEPGETKNFYALSQPFSRVYERFQGHNSPGANDITESQFRNWFETQLSLRNPDGDDEGPVLIEPFNDRTGAQEAPSDTVVHNFFPNGVALEDQNEVRLWRRMRHPQESAGNNIIENDLLADRLRASDMKATLDRSDVLGNVDSDNDIPGTVAGPDPTEPGNENPIDNTGFTIILWGTVKRPDDPATDDPPIGAIPAWCIERRESAGASLNQSFSNDVGGLTKSDFSTEYGFEEFSEFLDATVGGIGGGGGGFAEDPIIKTLVELPENKDELTDDTYIQSRSIDELGMSSLQLGYERLYPQINLNNNEWISDPDMNPNSGDEFVRIRLGDMLTPLAVGPTHDPSVLTRGDGWLTLSEALCGSLGYDGLGLGVIEGDPYKDLHVSTDRGNIRLDAYVPFFDANVDGVYDPDDGDIRRGTGNPMAVDLLDVFSTVDPEYGSIVKPTYGKININTAPIEVLRTLPQLSPPVGADSANGQSYWWWDASNATLHDFRSDIASTMEAYRDKKIAWTRDIANPNQNNGLNFGELMSDNGSDAYDPDPSAVDPTNAHSREARTGIVAVRETPGFASVGEVLNVRDILFNGGIGGGGGQYAAPHDMDRLGVADDGKVLNPINIDERGVESFFYDTDDDGMANETDEILSEFDQKLAIANGLFNTISVRSDIYAVWFVIHGYQRSDVEGLRPEEPMTPSVARRYLMIVDRSNVTELGDKPRILAVKQLPM